ncbi:hypothetical protein EYF80_024706 [Liparis tanakae]|uniref:Uncharacterized protein n=1 Tax=Liparis tanakae TaxID=230148 RepID=A0A4Z2HGW4_9TELE|nr:hypothetical protein EYF80_024706 [Liparis tanakae]
MDHKYEAKNCTKISRFSFESDVKNPANHRSFGNNRRPLQATEVTAGAFETYRGEARAQRDNIDDDCQSVNKMNGVKYPEAYAKEETASRDEETASRDEDTASRDEDTASRDEDTANLASHNTSSHRVTEPSEINQKHRLMDEFTATGRVPSHGDGSEPSEQNETGWKLRG